MTEKFHERFQIEVPIEEAKRRFVNRVGNELFRSGGWNQGYHASLMRAVATAVGEFYLSHRPPEEYTNYDFQRTLQAIEGMHSFLENHRSANPDFDKAVQELVDLAEWDLEIKWEHGKFYPTGAKLLDDALVNESLRWLRQKNYGAVLSPLEKGLDHLLRARAQPELLSDVVTDAYEALEALAKIFAGNDRTLDANRELFISRVKASEAYKRILREYIDFAHNFKHGASAPEKKPYLTYAETESFVYLTGLFIRLAISAGFDSSAAG